jgi:hypothetical protein
LHKETEKVENMKLMRKHPVRQYWERLTRRARHSEWNRSCHYLSCSTLCTHSRVKTMLDTLLVLGWDEKGRNKRLFKSHRLVLSRLNPLWI